MMNNLLKFLYERLWVPLFGRILMLLSTFIEGKKPKEKPTYDLTNKEHDS